MFKLLVFCVILIGVMQFGLKFASGSAYPIIPANVPEAHPGQTILKVKAHELDAYGQPWHGIGGTGLGYGGFMLLNLPTVKPPSLDLCVVTLSGSDALVTCNGQPYDGLFRMRRGGLTSLCPDHYDCSWAYDAPAEPYAIIVIDYCLGAPDANNLVDVALVAEPGQDTAAIANAARLVLPSLSRTRIILPAWMRAMHMGPDLTIMPNEEQRRLNPFPVFSRGECIQTCALSQSWFTMLSPA